MTRFTQTALEEAAELLHCRVAHIQAVAEVEAPKFGFFPDGSPRTLFEGHKFYKYTNGRFAASHPTLCFKHWTREHYGHSWREEANRLKEAISLDRKAALMSASWGSFQIMGFNFAHCGFRNVEEFVVSMRISEDNQLLAFTRYLLDTGLDDELRNCQWERFARLYNGPAWERNDYANRIAAAYRIALREEEVSVVKYTDKNTTPVQTAMEHLKRAMDILSPLADQQTTTDPENHEQDL